MDQILKHVICLQGEIRSKQKQNKKDNEYKQHKIILNEITSQKP